MTPPASDMTPEDLRQWRDGLGLSKRQAAARLGIQRIIYRQFESGTRAIPERIRLATQPTEAPP